MVVVRSVEEGAHVSLAPTLAERANAWLRDPWMWFVALVAVAAVALSTADIAIPLNRDEGAFLAIAQRVLQGGVPYRDVFDQKGPAVYYYLAGVLALTGPLSPLQRVLVARIGVVIIDIGTGLGILLLGRRWWSREVGLLAALFWFVAVPTYNGDQFFTEPFATAATVWALYAADRWPSLRGTLAAGALLALGSMFKQTAILSFPALAIVTLAASARAGAWWRPSRHAFELLGILIAGVVAPWLVVVAAFSVVGAFGPLLQQVVIANLAHYPPDPLRAIAASIRGSLDGFRILWLMAAATIVTGAIRMVALRRLPSAGAIALAILIPCNAVPFLTHAYNHYFLQLVPAAALLAAVGLVAVLNVWRPALGSRLSAPEASTAERHALLAPALIAFVALVGMNRPLPLSQWRQAYPDLQAQLGVGQWIASYAPAGVHPLVLPAEPGYYYLADRTTTTHYVYVLPINMTPAFMDQLSAQISAQRFPVIVWQQSGGGDGHEPYFAGLYATLKAHYHVVASLQSPEIYIFVPNS